MTEPKKRKSDRVIKFLEMLKLVEAEWMGKPFRLMPWMKEVCRGIFDSVGDDGYRKVREAYVSVPRKNAKSTFAAGLAVYFLFADGEKGGQVYCVANAREQAKICFRIIEGMVRQHPTLNAMSRITGSRSEIFVPKTNSRLKVISKIAGLAQGLSASMVIYDELHAAPNGELYSTMQTSMGARKQPLMLTITTAGYDRHSICYEKYTYAKRVLEGQIDDPKFYGYIKEADADDDPWSVETWAKANPGWGISVYPEALEALAVQAQNIPSEENHFRQYYLNQWVSNAHRWLSVPQWQNTVTGANIEDFYGCDFYCGLDLSSTQDLTAICYCTKQEDKYYLFPYFFLPKETIQTHKLNRNSYMAWERQGHLIGSIGNVVDYDLVAKSITDLAEHINIKQIAYDPWNSSYCVGVLASQGFEVIKYNQSFSVMSPACKDFERALLNKTLLHTNNPIMNWCVENVEILEDKSGNIRPFAPSEDNKIDGVIAGIMAYDLCMKNSITESSSGASVYEDRGIIAL